MKLAALFVPALLAVSMPCIAATAYDNGAPLGTNGNEATAWVQAEDFVLGSNTSLTGAGVYLAGFGGIGNFDGGFQYYIFSDAGGTPGGVVQTGNVTPVITDTGTPWDFGGNLFLFQFDFASAIDAVAGVTYYFGFHAGGAGDFGRDEIYWVNAAPNATVAGFESANGTFDNWSNNGVEHAFFLTDGGVVPEPATWALMIGGFGLVGGAMRRQTPSSARGAA